MQVDRAWEKIVLPMCSAVQPMSTGAHHAFATFLERFPPRRADGSGKAEPAGTSGLQAASSAVSGYAAAFNGTQSMLLSFIDRFRVNRTGSFAQSLMSRIRIGRP